MNQQWFKDIRHKVSQHTEPAPVFSTEEWDFIAASLPQKKATAFPVWMRVTAAASLVAAVTGIGLRQLRPSGPERTTVESVPVEVIPVEAFHREEAPAESVIPTRLERVKPTAEELPAMEVPMDTPPHSVAPLPMEDSRPAGDSVAKEVGKVADEVFPDVWESVEKSRGTHRLTAQAFLSGSVGAKITMSPRLVPANVIGMDASLKRESKELQTVGDTKIDVNHRLPFRAGVGLIYGLGGGWSLESGLSVSFHSSDYKTTSGIRTQELLFIGVPLNLKYRFTQWERFNLYASAGGLAEKMVAGSISTSDSGGRERISMHPLQFSVNASLGANYQISRRLSLYVEPGLRYGFDNGSGVNTIYSDRPTDFDLTVGLRVHIHEK